LGEASAFVVEQNALVLDPTAEAGEAAVGADHRGRGR